MVLVEVVEVVEPALVLVFEPVVGVVVEPEPRVVAGVIGVLSSVLPL